MNFKGTPAPWYIHDGSQLDKDGKSIIGTIDIITTPGYEKNVMQIGALYPYGKSRKSKFPDLEEARANAKLFAASLDLLNALDRLRRAHDVDGIELTEALIEADKAIDKALT